MQTELRKEIQAKLKSMKGKPGFFYKNLVTKESFGYQEDLPFEAASVIKIPVLIEAFRQMEEGKVSTDQGFIIHKEDKLPSCGALTYLHDGISVTFLDLCVLMIILSDNTATNLLIRFLGMERINQTMRELGVKRTTVNRLLFDAEKAAAGIENYIVPQEIGMLLEQMENKTLISKEASSRMLEIMKNQRLNGKMPFFVTDGTKIAHKTGEDDGITHDVGIVYAKEPFIACFCSNEMDEPMFNRFIQDTTKKLIEAVK
ncbi:MAG: serine hydrolase [Lachnospiraceae bacterium]|nr:serine hydrolase [Lachnospiraceae bacterium]